ncbi:WecB/TagA/CpsF family glycosyltransferase [Patescibacteria group bacterium]|nr:WecB/TagA/CpsF family glycosyltransferase [Patescibacteria group bacterium]
MSNRVEIAGIPFDPVTYGGVLTAIEVFVRGDKKVFITTPNPEMVLDANKNEKFLGTLNKSTMNIPDGIGILWASYYLDLPKSKNKYLQLFSSLSKTLFSPKNIRKILPERVTGSDLLMKVVDKSQGEKWRIFLLGARVGVAKKAIEKLLKKCPNAIFAGSYSGSPKKEEENYICEMINSAKPDILFVAYGSPAQEMWIERNLEKLHSTKVAIGVGGAFDFAAGKIKRAPSFMQKIGLEWLWRLVREPRRIKRIWNATVVFTKLIFRLKNKN